MIRRYLSNGRFVDVGDTRHSLLDGPVSIAPGQEGRIVADGPVLLERAFLGPAVFTLASPGLGRAPAEIDVFTP